jgi:hypothetical protein
MKRLHRIALKRPTRRVVVMQREGLAMMRSSASPSISATARRTVGYAVHGTEPFNATSTVVSPDVLVMVASLPPLLVGWPAGRTAGQLWSAVRSRPSIEREPVRQPAPLRPRHCTALGGDNLEADVVGTRSTVLVDPLAGDLGVPNRHEVADQPLTPPSTRSSAV